MVLIGERGASLARCGCRVEVSRVREVTRGHVMGDPRSIWNPWGLG